MSEIPLNENPVESMNGKTWCVISLMGHHQIAGLYHETTLAGTGFLCLEVPAHKGRPGFTRLYSPSAIYDLTPCTEEVARQALDYLRPDAVDASLLQPTTFSYSTNQPKLIFKPDTWTILNADRKSEDGT